ncbi:MAG TPA: pilus assembly PilX N-terminal domain-containing protein [Candidatus Saccharimonadales bacterium]|nr:pilus assembly PilX N-terminal domain-containing protein [Candidatus Saccharimonadales bacterium]
MNRPENQGFVLVTLLVIVTLIVITALATSQLALSNLQQATVDQQRLNTQFSADAGIDAAIVQLNQDANYTGSAGELQLFEDARSKTTYQTTVTNVDDDTKLLDVVAKVYSPKTATTPRVTRQFQVELRGVGGGSYSVVTGVGGLFMSNNAKIVGGNVYINGELQMSNSAQIGLSTNPLDVRVANQRCPVPPDATYPRVCNSGESGQPVTISGSAKIYGNVQATHQTNGAGMQSPGLVAGSPPAQPLPTHDRGAQTGAVATTITGSSAGCNNGTKTWAANTKITGDVTVSGTCQVTVQGDVWITGTITVRNSGKLIVNNGLITPPVIMIDGASGISLRNAAELASNSGAIGFRVVAYHSAAACSPDCADVTGTDLYNSRNLVTVSMENSASGPNTEFFARWSRVQINNAGNIGALVGQTVELKNSATVVFGTTVGGSTPQTWVVQSYRRDF